LYKLNLKTLNLVPAKILDGNEVKAMPESIPSPSLVQLQDEKKTTSQMGHMHQKNYLKKLI